GERRWRRTQIPHFEGRPGVHPAMRRFWHFLLCIALATGGAAGPAAQPATALGFGTKGAAFVAAKAGVQAVAASTVVGPLNHQGNVGKAVEDLGKPEGLRAIATSILTAGLVENVTQTLKLPDAPKTFGEHFQNAAIKAAVSLPVNMALGGVDPDKALGMAAISTAANTVGGFAATKIGQAYGAESLSYAEHKALHAGLGAITGAILDPKNPGKGAAAGALGSVVGEVVAEALPEHLTRETRADYGKIAAATGALLAKQDVPTAIVTADTALQNNFLPHAAVGGGLAVAANTEEGQELLEKLDAKTQAALEKEHAVGFENLNSAEQFLVGAYHTGVLKDFAYQELDTLTNGKLSLVNDWVSKGLQWTGEVAGDALKSINASETLASYGAAFTVGAVGSLVPSKAQSLAAINKTGKKLTGPIKISRVEKLEAPAKRSVVVDKTHFSPNSSIQPLEQKGRVIFDGVEFRAVRNLEHLDEGTLREIYKKGTAPKDINQIALRGHHYQQQYHREPGAFIVEIPESAHSIGTKIQHPLGNKKGAGLIPEQRADWDKVRNAFYKERAKQELIRRGALNEQK
ncbi:MAG: DUF637 domain-containing protein, partial [Alphaproteobacteria bacterium]